MKRIYVAGLYSRTKDGKTANVIEVLHNIRAGLKASLEIWRLGFAPYSPWLDYQFSLIDDEPISKEMYYQYSMCWLEVSDAVLVISGNGINGGVDAEIRRAKELGILVFYSIDELLTN